MSTAKKRTIKYVALVASLILVIAYFSLLSPTSAYFYKTQEATSTIKFEMFDVKQTVFENENVLKFKGATKLCDTKEILFDDVAIVKEITVLNNGESKVDARILVDITPLEDSVANGFRYVAFIKKSTDTSDTTKTIKEELAEKFGIDENSSKEDIEAKIDAHNEKLRSSNEDEDKFILAPGESATVRIIFWIEYDPAQTAAGGESVWQNAGKIANIEYPCEIRIIATQDNDEAASEAVTEEITTVEETTVEETVTEIQ